jgi:hypothetical protein
VLRDPVKHGVRLVLRTYPEEFKGKVHAKLPRGGTCFPPGADL